MMILMMHPYGIEYQAGGDDDHTPQSLPPELPPLEVVWYDPCESLVVITIFRMPYKNHHFDNFGILPVYYRGHAGNFKNVL